MKYEKTDNYSIKIIPENEEKIEDILLELAATSYETAVPRMHTKKHMEKLKRPSSYFSQYITKNVFGQEQLVMDYIDDRDCRTIVSKQIDGNWYLNCYSFEQRGLDSDEFFEKINSKDDKIKLHNSIELLDDVVKRIEEKYKNHRKEKKKKFTLIDGEKN
ncbi:hypothetical protein HOK51_07025 [Candidatus Woesearchaeota archaeon]|jgi:hypothetical protein|nr:hypothetical protein [Candidatus Woesearchaeota archaeon]MBT6519575.1 hypothetical protein [Candidatus Woesearchaeota archaeon]MBT7367680.1 hypothetical protein [Candidatus Woesearchaeota archaeon]